MNTKDIIAKSVRSEDYNSNNAWGFGGKRGKFYYFEDPSLSFFKGSFDYRHIRSQPVELFYYDGKSIDFKTFLECLSDPDHLGDFDGIEDYQKHIK